MESMAMVIIAGFCSGVLVQFTTFLCRHYFFPSKGARGIVVYLVGNGEHVSPVVPAEAALAPPAGAVVDEEGVSQDAA